MIEPTLQGHVIVVTGASGRLGRVLTAHLAGAGARVAALDLAPPSALPSGAQGFGADLGDEAAVAEAFAKAEGSLGPIKGLVHTVGMWDGGPLAETTLASWERMFRVNLTSAFLCVREAVRRMTAHGEGGSLVGIASRQGADAGPAQQAAYAASKAGVIRLFEATSAEHAEAGITASTVAPSTILFGGEDEGTAGVTAESVARLCAYLCGEGGAVHKGATLRAYGSAG